MKKSRNPTCLILLTGAGFLAAAGGVFADSRQPIWSARDPLSSYEANSPLLDPNTLSIKSESSSAALVFKPNNNVTLYSSLLRDQRQDGRSASVPWCAEASGFLRIGSLGQECLMRGTLQFELPGQVASAQTGINVEGNRWDFSLSYGLSRLIDTDIAHLNQPFFIPGGTNVANSTRSINLVNMESQGIALGSQWRLTQASALQLNAALNQLRLHSPLPASPILSLNRADAGVGLVYGPFSGNISGYVQRSKTLVQDNKNLWGGLDIGVSWRTPWQGELTVGARNFVTKGEQADISSLQEPTLDMSSTRTPYVRYKQDL